MRNHFWFAKLGWVLLAGAAFGQTFEIPTPSQATAPSHQQQSPGAKGVQGERASGLAWGSGIAVARQARAARDALQKGDFAAATRYAQQAAQSAPQETDLWFLLGYAARLSGRYSLSLEAYQRGLQRRPHSVSGLAGLAQTYAKMGQEEKARQILQQVVAANPRDANVLQFAGELFLNSDPQRALELLKRAEALQASARAELLLSRAYQRLDQPEQAEKFLARARSRAPHDPEVLRAVAGLYRDAGQYDSALAALQALPSKTPDILAELAYTYQLAGKEQQAADLYAQAARQAKENIGLQLNAAQALVDLGQADAAASFLQNARSLDAENYRLHAILGNIAETEGRLPEAIQEYEYALDHLPASVTEGPLYPVQLRLNLYFLHEQANNTSKAKEQLELAAAQIEGVSPSEKEKPEYLRLRAAIGFAEGDLAGAERDLQAALALAPSDVNSIVDYAALLSKLGQKEAARKMFARALDLDKGNRQALLSLGDLARDMGDARAAQEYFSRAASLDPKSYAPHLALGDLYASEEDYARAQASYEEAYQRMPANPLIVAGGANSALEMRNLDLAKHWLDRAAGPMNDNPQVMRERQRYLTWTRDYQQAAELGQKVIARMPRDPQAPIYLAYDLYYLGRYREAFDLVSRYEPIFPNNKDLALIAGYVHVHDGEYEEAREDFTRALERDPRMATGYVNRGYVLNHLQEPGAAAKDFEAAIDLAPDYGEAHLGLAYAYLQLRRARPALKELDIAEKLLGQTRVWHLARAEAFRQEQKLAPAAAEYRAALQEKPDDLATQLALADTLYRMRHYEEALAGLRAALKLSPGDATIFARMAQAHARLEQMSQAQSSIQAAEQAAKGNPDVLMHTGDALLELGEREAAMQRFSQALEADGADRVTIRLAIARIFLREGRWDDARRTIALGFAEARVGEAPDVTADNFVEAANLFLAMHDFALAQSYFVRARRIGASERVVAIGLANTYLAQGNTEAAHSELASLGDPSAFQDDYDYTVAMANLYRQRQDTVHALSAFARASTLAGPDDRAAIQEAQYELAGETGKQVTPQLSLSPRSSWTPELEDINVYTLDARIQGVSDPALLPPPRHSQQILGLVRYRTHLQDLPDINGFFGQSRTAGRLFFPSTGTVQDRRTYDTTFNTGISQPLRLGSNTLVLNPGLQFTIRRDSVSPLNMNQNLFRQFLYLSTSSFFNWVSIRGSAVHETGPFTEQNLHSRDLSASLEFTVGRPWGSTALVTGYSVRDLLFRPTVREYFTTSTWLGLQRRFGRKLEVAVLGEYLRSWQVQNNKFAIAQAMRPRFRFDYRPSPHWQVQGSFALSRGQGFHAYDNVQSEFLVTYVRPVETTPADGTGTTQIGFPSRFSLGVRQQTFYNFAGTGRTVLLPVVRFTLF